MKHLKNGKLHFVNLQKRECDFRTKTEHGLKTHKKAKHYENTEQVTEVSLTGFLNTNWDAYKNEIEEEKEYVEKCHT